MQLIVSCRSEFHVMVSYRCHYCMKDSLDFAGSMFQDDIGYNQLMLFVVCNCHRYILCSTFVPDRQRNYPLDTVPDPHQA